MVEKPLPDASGVIYIILLMVLLLFLSVVLLLLLLPQILLKSSFIVCSSTFYEVLYSSSLYVNYVFLLLLFKYKIKVIQSPLINGFILSLSANCLGYKSF